MIKNQDCPEDFTPENLRILVLEKLSNMGFTMGDHGELVFPKTNKDAIRKLHEPARQLELDKRKEWLQNNLHRYIHYFASGREVIPSQIKPSLIEVISREQHTLFRIARLQWSLPFSKGYGRRLRFLIFDESNGKLIGILALQSPPLSFPARDRIFNYPDGRKTELVNQTMDIQTLGAVSPYNRLLGGKLVALAASSSEVRTVYKRKYENRETEMEGRILPPHLVALTTTSAFGRSSIYNRLVVSLPPRKGKSRHYAISESLGYTEGYGSFHLMELYPLFREFLENRGISTRGGFGKGPRRKWQTMVRALAILGFSSDLLKHGVKREAFLFPLADNLREYVEGQSNNPVYRDLPFQELSNFWLKRWLLPRSERVDGWHEWERDQVYTILGLKDGIK
jgi:hypothetical protein